MNYTCYDHASHMVAFRTVRALYDLAKSMDEQALMWVARYGWGDAPWP